MGPERSRRQCLQPGPPDQAPPPVSEILCGSRSMNWVGAGQWTRLTPVPAWAAAQGSWAAASRTHALWKGVGKPAHAGETASHIDRREQVYQPVPEPGTPRCGQRWWGGQVSRVGRLPFLQDPVLAAAPAGGAFLGGEITWVAPPQAGAFYALQPRCAQGPAAPQPLAAVCNAEPQARDRQMQCQQPRGPVRSWC